MTYKVTTIIRWLWQSSRYNRLQALINTVLGLLGVCVSLGSVWAVHRAIDVASHNVEGTVLAAVGIMALLTACRFAISAVQIWVKNMLGVKAQNRMQRYVLERILRSEWRGREAMHSGDVMSRLESDVQTVVNFVAETLPSTISVGALFLGAFCYLFSMDHTLAIIITVMFPIFLVLSKFYIKKMRALTREVRESDSRVQSTLQESVQNSMLVKTLEAERMMVGRVEKLHDELHHKVLRRTVFSLTSNLTVAIGFSIGYLTAFAWSATRLSMGSLTFGGMAAFLQLVNRIQNPARDLASLAPEFVRVFTSAERLMELEQWQQEEQGEPQLLQAPCGVALRNVSYAYADEPDKMIVDHLSFDFKPGTCTAIVGETGAGKTTVLRMLLALVKPTKGRVALYDDSQTLTSSPLTRCNITYVPQGNTLLSGSIRANLAIGNPDATDEEMRKALSMACADFVNDLPEGLDTTFSEGGTGMSEGQAQRVCIARALLRQCPVMILDEATSALDPDTEKRLLQNILAEGNHTVIFITHRPAVLDYCDAVLRLERS